MTRTQTDLSTTTDLRENNSFTNQKRRIATDEDCNAAWNGAKNGVNFRCYLCGHRFKIGDGWRWVYSVSRHFKTPDGKRFGVTNFLVCDACDGEDVLDRWVNLHIEFYNDKFWALRR